MEFHFQGFGRNNGSQPASPTSCQTLSLKRKRLEPIPLLLDPGQSKRVCSDYLFSTRHIEALFNSYSVDSETIHSHGMLQFCKDLGVDTMDVALLVLSYKLNVGECGIFTKQEFVQGLSNLGISSLTQIKECLPSLREYAITHVNEIYTYAFHTMKEFETQLTIPLEGALEMIRILSHHLPHSLNFVRYMKIQKEYTGMNLDQWNMFLQFNYHITLDFENYDENCAWPVMIDDFVAFMKDDKNWLFQEEENITSIEISNDNGMLFSNQSSNNNNNYFNFNHNNNNNNNFNQYFFNNNSSNTNDNDGQQEDSSSIDMEVI